MNKQSSNSSPNPETSFSYLLQRPDKKSITVLVTDKAMKIVRRHELGKTFKARLNSCFQSVHRYLDAPMCHLVPKIVGIEGAPGVVYSYVMWLDNARGEVLVCTHEEKDIWNGLFSAMTGEAQ